MAEQTTGLFAALLAVQAEAPAIQKTKINPAFRSKYVSLDSLMETVMPILNAHGLVWTTLPCRDEHGDPALTYRLIYAPTGESLDGTMPLMLAKSDPQGQGSAITYGRRYSLMAVLGLVADEDDDGNSASKSNGSTKQRPAMATTADIGELQAAANGLTPNQIKLTIGACGISANGWSDIPKAKVAELAKKLAAVEREVPA